MAVVLYQVIAFVGPDCLNKFIFSSQVTIILIKRWSSATEVINDKIRLVAELVPQSADGAQLYSSCKLFLELLGGDE
jgi:hypothetical protein